MLPAMRGKLLAVAMVALWAWVVPVAQAMPIDADGPSGLSDNADFDDLIVSVTSPTLATTPALPIVVGVPSIVIAIVTLLAPCPVSEVVRPSVESRAPPLA
jgi:hypothetical protein